jgi:hypothetical protein
VKRFIPLLSAPVLAAAVLALAASAARSDDDPWAKGASWASIRFGGVRALYDHAPDGNVGFGVAYRKMVSPRFSIGASLDQDLIGKYGAAANMEMPLSIEYLAHFHWKAPIHPALGAGFSVVYHKMYRTGDDISEIQPGAYMVVALNTAVDHNTAIGVEWRLGTVSTDYEGNNPSFGILPPSSGRMSIKLSVARIYW